MPKTYKWDLFVRLTHWIVAGSFLTNYLITEEGSKTHQWIGYLLMIWILWSGLLLTGLSGWATQLDMLWVNDWLSELHGALANLTMLATISHIATIVIMSHWTDHNYLKNILLHKK
ncbi:hypothetical protein EAY27_03295 [Vibrio anguillarum]|uniref:hypothetical protein n=1 Tax=Vibrio anguillarum TaxID=55601 RepID=UPI00188C7E07|nr:hypothetical protein [Vibrio anguillarum]MBF4255653.1 hypothetical protein [Vibrio anguillarum]MBF4276234.1 hypothetical protein [Vibrio anguillarum]MBF4299245.1 hypothetical protein [Vibrio anguillarum]MBF4362923.1 hypothetical protein [Vibrio anguillarum]MBF4396412.1 hypothetical protein [Vibrio anguillarum]